MNPTKITGRIRVKEEVVMKKHIILFVVSILCVSTVKAQWFGFNRVSDVPNTVDYCLGKVKWTDRKLRWDDFRASKNPNSNKASFLHLYAQPVLKKKKIDGVNYKYYCYESYLIQDDSWVENKDLVDSRLKHCQNQFDLWEALTRRVAMDYPFCDGLTMGQLFDRYQREFDKQIDQMNTVTDQGGKFETVDSISNVLAKELVGNEVDPVEIVDRCKSRGKTVVLDAAILTHIPFSDYMGASFGGSFGGGFNVGKNVFTMDLAMELGEFHKDIRAKKGYIEKGDRMYSGGINVYYGRTMCSKKTLEVTPVVGIGMRFLDGGEKYEEYRKSKGDNRIEILGFSAGAGVIFDFIYRRTINMMYNFYGVVRNERSVRLKPYFSLTRYSNGLGWVPALNISVGINGKEYRLKR